MEKQMRIELANEYPGGDGYRDSGVSLRHLIPKAASLPFGAYLPLSQTGSVFSRKLLY